MIGALERLLAPYQTGPEVSPMGLEDLAADPVYGTLARFAPVPTPDPAQPGAPAVNGGLGALQPGRMPAQGGPLIGDTPAEAKALARRMARKRGYSGADWRQLKYIIDNESGWDYQADNPTSTAVGIPQTMASVHLGGVGSAEYQHFMANPKAQLKWLFDYISGRYGGVSGAYEHKQETGWY